jgi:hypothetical protein
VTSHVNLEPVNFKASVKPFPFLRRLTAARIARPLDAEKAFPPSEIAAELLRPEFWADLANLGAPSGPDRTPWFPGNVEPARPGWYERFFFASTPRQYWNGELWLEKYVLPCRTHPRFWPCWRGLFHPSE